MPETSIVITATDHLSALLLGKQRRQRANEKNNPQDKEKYARFNLVLIVLTTI